MCFPLLRLYLWFPKAWLWKDFSVCLCGNLLQLVLSSLDLWCDVWHESRVFRGIIVLSNVCLMFHSMHVAPFVMFHCSCVLSVFVSLFFSQFINAFFTIPSRLETLCLALSNPVMSPAEAVCISTRVYLGLGILFAFFSWNLMLLLTLSSVLACYVLFLLKYAFRRRQAFLMFVNCFCLLLPRIPCLC